MEADTILNVLSVRRENLAVILPTMASLPFLIEFSSTAWVKSIAAVQLGAMDFLLNSLKFHFAADYDRNKQTCEQSMQQALKGLISDFIPDLVYVDNITLRWHGKTLTDIDFAAADEADGTLLLFQLKHQDHYGADMRKRSSRAEHLRNKCASWLSAVRDWLGRCAESEIRSSLRLKGSFRLQAPRIVFLTRHFAHFLSDLDLQNDTAYATWIQMFDALNRLRAEGRPLTLISLFDLLKAYMSHKMERGHPFEMVDTYHLENLSYRIRPRSAVRDEPLAV